MGIKVFALDWDSANEISKALNQLKSRIGELHARTGTSSRTRKARQLQVCQTIFNTNISQLYEGLPLDVEKKYYVYAHLDTSHRIVAGKHGVSTFAATLGMPCFPFYIGKGCGDRCFDLNRSETHRKVAQRLRFMDQQIGVVVLQSGLTESEALQMEAKLIDIFGLIPYGGLLANLDEGHRPYDRRNLYRESFMLLRHINPTLVKNWTS